MSANSNSADGSSTAGSGSTESSETDFDPISAGDPLGAIFGTSTRGQVIAFLGRDPMSRHLQCEIADSIGSSQAQVSKVCSQLQEMELIDRSSGQGVRLSNTALARGVSMLVTVADDRWIDSTSETAAVVS